MGFISLARGALRELARDPVLFLPKLVSTTLYIPPYLVLVRSSVEAAKNPLLSQGLLGAEAPALLALFALAPLWIFIDSMYPELVRQRSETGKLGFRAAARHVLGRFPKILAVTAILLAIGLAAMLPFAALAALGVVFASLPLIALGALGLAAAVFVLGIAFYFTPTSIVIGEGSVLGSLREGYALSRANFGPVFWLTLLSFALLLAGFYAEGAFSALGEAGFVAGRYLGAVVTVYLYVLNPSAYLEVRKPGAAARQE
ncbi:MAG: hypothetical protein PHF51_03560 [Candidatus ainarchaeum sp.]|nr:hypothetical protein [Candidatus ainarchaeum sp.]